jgi:hypothetical protein
MLETFKNHAIYPALAHLHALASSKAMLADAVVNSPRYAYIRDRLLAIGSLISTQLESTPPVLISLPSLDSLTSHLNGFIGALNLFQTDANLAHLDGMLGVLDNQVTSLLIFAFLPSSKNLPPKAWADMLQAQTETAQTANKQLMAERDALAQHLKDLEAKTKDLDARLELSLDSIAKDRAQASAEVANLNRVFNEEELVRRGTFEAALLKIKDDAVAEAIAVKDAAGTVMSNLRDYENQSRRIFNLVGGAGIFGNYQQIANSESEQADLWRSATLLIFLTGMGLAGATFYKFWNQTIDSENWTGVVIRLFYAIAITVPALYTARESARHRTNADRARQTELELASLGPFIELMPEDKKTGIREELTKHYFGKTVEQHEVKAPVDSEMLKGIAEIIKAARKG